MNMNEQKNEQSTNQIHDICHENQSRAKIILNFIFFVTVSEKEMLNNWYWKTQTNRLITYGRKLFMK